MVAETLYPQSLDTELAQARKATIESVLRTGLLPASRLAHTQTSYMGSADVTPHPVVYGVAIGQERNSPMYQAGLRSLARDVTRELQGRDGVIPVIVERFGEKEVVYQDLPPEDSEKQALFSERALASFLVVCDHKEGGPTRKLHGVPSHQFMQAVFPENVWEEYQEMGGEAYGIPIATIAETVMAPIGGLPYQIRVPNYTEHVKRLVLSEGKDVWIHGVRVPTIDDLHRANRNPALV